MRIWRLIKTILFCWKFTPHSSARRFSNFSLRRKWNLITFGSAILASYTYTFFIDINYCSLPKEVQRTETIQAGSRIYFISASSHLYPWESIWRIRNRQRTTLWKNQRNPPWVIYDISFCYWLVSTDVILRKYVKITNLLIIKRSTVADWCCMWQNQFAFYLWLKIFKT